MMASRAGEEAHKQSLGAGAVRRRRRVLPAILLTLIVLLAAASSVSAAAGAPGGRRQLWQLRRRMPQQQQQPCGTCPTDNPGKDAAKAACQKAAQPDRDALLRGVVQHCPRQAFSPAACCPSMPVADVPKWALWAACLW